MKSILSLIMIVSGFAGASVARADRIADLNELAFRAMRSAWTPGTNGIVSTFGLMKSLATLYPAARGETAAAFRELFHNVPPDELWALISETERRTTLQTEVGLWWYRRSGDTADYRDMLSRFAGVTNAAVDFPRDAARIKRGIDQWGEQVTKGAITNITSDYTVALPTRLILAGATDYTLAFAPEHGRPDVMAVPFTTGNKTQVTIPMMMALSRFRTAQFGDVTVLELPTSEDDTTVLALMPPVGKLAELMNVLTSEKMDMIDRDMTFKRSIVLLPVLHEAQSVVWQPHLARLGLARLLSGRTADLSGIDGNPGWLYLNLCAQAVTLTMTPAERDGVADRDELAHALPPMPVMVNRPFVYLVRDRQSGLILLGGWFVQPGLPPDAIAIIDGALVPDTKEIR